jgi:hypothetical protein
MMEQPYVGRNVGIESTVGFEVEKELLPLLTKAMGYVVPEPFNASVVNAPD